MSTQTPSVTDAVQSGAALLAKADEVVAELSGHENRLAQARLDAELADDAEVDRLVKELQGREDDILDYLNTAQQYCDNNLSIIESYAAQIDAKIVGWFADSNRANYQQRAKSNASANPIRLKDEPSDVVDQLVELGKQIEELALQDPALSSPKNDHADYFVRAFTLVEQARAFHGKVHAYLEAYYNRWYDAEMREAERHQDVRGNAIRGAGAQEQRAHDAWMARWRGEWKQAVARAVPSDHANGWVPQCPEGRLVLSPSCNDLFEDTGCLGGLRRFDGMQVRLNDSLMLWQGEGDERQSLKAFEGQIWLNLAAVCEAEHRLCLCSANGSIDHSSTMARYVKDLPAITGGRVLTDTASIAQALQEHVALMDDALQGKLVGYGSVEEFNRKNKAKPIPWRLLCVSHFPTGFDERMTANLLRLVEQGPRAGIKVLVQGRAEAGARYGSRADELVSRMSRLPQAFRPCVGQSSSVCESVIDARLRVVLPVATKQTAESVLAKTAAAIERRANASLDLKDLLPKDRFQRTSAARRIVLPFGINEDGKVQCMELGDVVAHGSSSFALVIGPTGSGKSVFLHNLITSALYCYPPSELQLCLLDFKEGTEFAAYANTRLPHLRYVALDSMQQFGESVLARLEELMATRAQKFKEASEAGTPIHNIAQYRAAGHQMPRILVIMDEFQELFDCDRDRRCANRAAAHFGAIVSKGRAYGIHMVLATQTLHRIYEGNYAIAKASLEELHVRVGLKCSEREFANLMGTQNAALCRQKAEGGRGSAVYMEDYLYGTPQGVRVAYVEPERRVKLLQLIAARYEGQRFKPAFVFRGTQEAQVPLAQLARASREKRKVYVGQPVALGKNVGFDVAPGVQSNLLVLGEDQRMLRRIGATVLSQTVACATMARQVFLVDAEALREGDAEGGLLGRLRDHGLKVPKGVVRGTSNAFQVLPVLREAYELFDRRRKALASGERAAHADDPVYLVILNYQQIDPLVCLMEGRSVADYEVVAAPAAAPVAADPLQAMLDELAADLANDSAPAASPTVPPRQMLRTLLESGHLCNVHTVLTCGSTAVLGRLMRSDVAPFNHRLVLPAATGVHQYVDTDIDLRKVGSNCVLYADGQHETCLVKPFQVTDLGEVDHV